MLFGPTAVGKTALLADLFLENRELYGLPRAEVVSADSMQVYRGMDVGTAKPSAAERAALPHHLIDIRDPAEQFTAGDFVALADAACADIHARGCLPVVAGGTAFYLRNFLCGLPETPPADAAVRDGVARALAERGAAALHRELADLDPASAARISPNDAYRITRALEVCRATGRPLSAFAVPGELRARWRFVVVALARPRDELYARIDARVDAMFAAGLRDEVGRLGAAGCGPEAPGMKAIGYREFFEEPDGAPDRLERVREAVKRDSRRYAKRQMVFFKSLPGVTTVDADDRQAVVRAALAAARGAARGAKACT